MYLVQNKIAKVQAGELDWCSDTITSIELGGNRIRVRFDSFSSQRLTDDKVIENLEKLVHLTELWLGKNKIRTLEVSRLRRRWCRAHE
jgi:protein phosphatase 1 regulatory subunit 7